MESLILVMCGFGGLIDTYRNNEFLFKQNSVKMYLL